MMRVSVLIPTFRRPEGLKRAVRSVFAQRCALNVEVIVVDNSPEGGALEACETLATEATMPFQWIHAPQPGVAQARNAALAVATGHFIAWLDDDEEAPSHWLDALLTTHHATGAPCVFGPVRASAPESARSRAYFEDLYSRLGPPESGLSTISYGIGNSLQTRNFFNSQSPFDTRADQTGGEDDRLFADARVRGERFAWAANAWVTEYIDANRARLPYALKRAFAYGQGPCETAWTERDLPALARHMAIGAAQALVYGAAALGLTLMRRDAINMLDRAVRGAGKVLWFWEQRFYGEALTKTQPA